MEAQKKNCRKGTLKEFKCEVLKKVIEHAENFKDPYISRSHISNVIKDIVSSIQLEHFEQHTNNRVSERIGDANQEVEEQKAVLNDSKTVMADINSIIDDSITLTEATKTSTEDSETLTEEPKTYTEESKTFIEEKLNKDSETLFNCLSEIWKPYEKSNLFECISECMIQVLIFMGLILILLGFVIKLLD